MISKKNQGPTMRLSLLFSSSEDRVLRSCPKGTLRLVGETKSMNSLDSFLISDRDNQQGGQGSHHREDAAISRKRARSLQAGRAACVRGVFVENSFGASGRKKSSLEI